MADHGGLMGAIVGERRQFRQAVAGRQDADAAAVQPASRLPLVMADDPLGEVGGDEIGIEEILMQQTQARICEIIDPGQALFLTVKGHVPAMPIEEAISGAMRIGREPLEGRKGLFRPGPDLWTEEGERPLPNGVGCLPRLYGTRACRREGRGVKAVQFRIEAGQIAGQVIARFFLEPDIIRRQKLSALKLAVAAEDAGAPHQMKVRDGEREGWANGRKDRRFADQGGFGLGIFRELED